MADRKKSRLSPFLFAATVVVAVGLLCWQNSITGKESTADNARAENVRAHTLNTVPSRSGRAESGNSNGKTETVRADKGKRQVVRSEAELRKQLTPLEYKVTQEKDTETPFTGAYYKNHEKGVYRCVVCGEPLFSSDTKFDSGSGWPSFYKPIDKESVETNGDKSLGVTRTEVVCQKCGAHLGHVFNDGPKPTHLRYCINSCALNFKRKK